MYLLDTNVVSELRRARPHGAVLQWLSSVNDTDLHISAVTIGELQEGIESTRERDPSKADDIEAWLERIMETFDVLPVDGDSFRIWARLMHRRPVDLIEDAMIAATAISRGMTVVTRNVRDFAAWDVPVLDPFSPAP